jgi:hypothetical protein
MPRFLSAFADLAIGEVGATVAKIPTRSKDEPRENRERPPAAINSA